MQKRKNKEKSNSIVAKIKRAMFNCSAVCLGILGVVSLGCVTGSVQTILDDNMTETAEGAAGLIEREIAAMKQVRAGAMASTELSNEQAAAMQKLEDEMNQITDVVVSNSAAAEESSAICEELSAQATGLNELVEEFEI